MSGQFFLLPNLGSFNLSLATHFYQSENVSVLCIQSNYLTPTIRKGNKNIALSSLKTNPIVRPTILNGNNRSQISGNNTSMINASGQHKTIKIHHRSSPIRVFITEFFELNRQKPSLCCKLKIVR